VRGSRRSFATRPGGTLPTPLGARPAPIRKNGGALNSNPSASRGLWRIPNSVGWSGSLAGAASPMEVLLSSTHLPGGAPTTVPDLSGAKPRRTFRPQPARGPVEACPIRRTAQGRGRINRKASLHEVKPGPPSRSLAARACPRDRRPAPDDWRPLREAIARGPSNATSATFAFAKPPWTHRNAAKRTEKLASPTLSRTVVNLKKFLPGCNEKSKYS